MNISWICQLATFCFCTLRASNSAKTFKLLPAREECSLVALHLMVGAEGDVLVLGIGRGVMQAAHRIRSSITVHTACSHAAQEGPGGLQK